MDCSCIPYARVPKSTPLYLDYIGHFERVARFYNGPPFDPGSYRKVANELAGHNQFRNELGAILTRQNRVFGSSELAFANIQRLAHSETLAVVTGQQVGLLSGPAFTIYKALTAVRLAESLSEQGLPSVPVFWLATEDHDLEEVAQAIVLDDQYNAVTLKDSGLRPAPHSSVGYVRLTEEIRVALNRLESVLPAGEFRDRLLEDLRACYVPGSAWGEAFGRLMARLFGRWGVVLLDALDPDLHQLASGVYEQAITEAQALRERLRRRSKELVQAGYHAQVHVSEDSTLLFVAQQGNRIALHQPHEERGNDFFLDGTARLPSAELKSWVKDRPVDFSPNALLRPIVQDVLLPTVAYVAGPAELAYHAQTQVLYSGFGRPQPVLFPRAGFTLLDSRTRRILRKYRLTIEDVWLGEEHLRHRIAAVGFAEGWSERLDQSEQDLIRLLERLRGDIAAIDSTLLDSLGRAEAKMRYQLERLRGKIAHAAVERSELLRRQAEALERFLAPHKDLQERQVSGVYFLGCAGYSLLDRLFSQVQTRSSDHQVLDY